MIKKSIFATLLVAAMCAFSTPAQAQFKGLGKSLGKSAKDLGKAAQNMATDAAMEMGANKASDKIVEFMDQNNVVVADDSDYAVRLKSIVGSNFADIDGKALDIKLYENDEANVIALNNGSIRIYTGMLDVLSDDEVQAVIALQAAQINAGNVRDNLLKAATGESAENAGSAQVEKMVASLSVDQIGTIINELVQLPYTQEQNVAADKIAKDYLKKQGGDVDAYSTLVTKIQAVSLVDLEADDLDEEDETVVTAVALSKFANVNKLR